MGSLADDACAALHKGADVDADAVDGQRIRAKIAENLAVEQHCQDAHRHVGEERGKTGERDFAQLVQKMRELHETQCTLITDEVRQHDACRQQTAKARRQTCAHDAQSSTNTKK